MRERERGKQADREHEQIILINKSCLQEREKRGLTDSVSITRVEQLHPFPYDLIQEELQRFPDSEVLYGSQE